jgi:hypothetical protein
MWKYHKEIPCEAILNKQKCHLFFLSFEKSENRKAKHSLPGRVDTSGSKEEVGKRCKRVNMV